MILDLLLFSVFAMQIYTLNLELNLCIYCHMCQAYFNITTQTPALGAHANWTTLHFLQSAYLPKLPITLMYQLLLPNLVRCSQTFFQGTFINLDLIYITDQRLKSCHLGAIAEVFQNLLLSSYLWRCGCRSRSFCGWTWR